MGCVDVDFWAQDFLSTTLVFNKSSRRCFIALLYGEWVEVDEVGLQYFTLAFSADRVRAESEMKIKVDRYCIQMMGLGDVAPHRANHFASSILGFSHLQLQHVHPSLMLFPMSRAPMPNLLSPEHPAATLTPLFPTVPPPPASSQSPLSNTSPALPHPASLSRPPSHTTPMPVWPGLRDPVARSPCCAVSF